MHLLVLRSWRGDVDALARGLAEVLGKYIPEARMRLLGAGPIVVASFRDAEPAATMADALRYRGFTDLFVLRGDDDTAAKPCFVRDFALGDSELRVADPRQSYDVPYGEIELLLRGTRVESHTTRDRYSTRQFSLARTLLSGGLLITRKVESVRTHEIEERTAFLHLVAGQRPVMVLTESDLRFRSLGAALQPSRQANFQLLVTELRRRAPAAIYDDRLGQRGGQVQLLGPGLAPDRHLGLALVVLARALRPKT